MRAPSQGRRRGLLLMEAVVYLGVVTVIMSLGMTLLYRGQANHRQLQRNADDIARTLEAGERWRADVRAAVCPPWLEAEMLRIPQAGGEVVYLCEDGIWWRIEEGPPAVWVPVLPGVKRAQILPEQTAGIPSFRCEIELAADQKAAQMTPRFSFQAVPGGRAAEGGQP